MVVTSPYNPVKGTVTERKLEKPGASARTRNRAYENGEMPPLSAVLDYYLTRIAPDVLAGLIAWRMLRDARRMSLKLDADEVLVSLADEAQRGIAPKGGTPKQGFEPTTTRRSE